MTLSKIDATLKTLAGVCAVLAGSSYAGFIPPMAAIIIGFAAGLFAFLAGSPMLDPTLVGKTPWLSRACLTIAGLCTAAAGSSFFPSVQHLFSDGHAQKLATGLTMLGALCTFLSQSPILAGANGGPFPPDVTRTLALLLGLSLFGVSGCSFFQKHVDAITTDVESCITPNASADKAALEHAAGQFLAQTLMCDAEAGFNPYALPACAADAIPGIEASLGPDGKAFVTCALNKIENDPNALAKQKARAHAARVSLAR